MTSKQTDAALEASAAELGLQGTKMADLEAEAAAAAAAAAPKAEYASSRQGDAGSNASGNTRNADSVPGGVIAPAPPPAVEPPKSPPSRVFGDAAPAAPSAARDGSPTTGLIRDHPTRPGVATIKAHTEALGS